MAEPDLWEAVIQHIDAFQADAQLAQLCASDPVAAELHETVVGLVAVTRQHARRYPEFARMMLNSIEEHVVDIRDHADPAVLDKYRDHLTETRKALDGLVS